MEADHRSEVPDAGLAGWPTVVGADVGRRVVEVLTPAGVGGEREHIGRRAELDRFAEPVGDLVGIHGCLVVEVDHRSDGEPALWAEEVAEVGGGDGPFSLSPSQRMTPAWSRVTVLASRWR